MCANSFQISNSWAKNRSFDSEKSMQINSFVNAIYIKQSHSKKDYECYQGAKSEMPFL